MAHIDEANLNGYIRKHANISGVVGIGGRNEKNDVMVIQALIRLCGITDSLAAMYFDVKSAQLPAINGIFDRKTSQSIWSFQRANSRDLLSVDGVVHPASYEHRTIKSGPMMTITLLNRAAAMYGLSDLGMDVVPALNFIAPQIFLMPQKPRA
jgi:hypothetical protein